MNAYLHQALKWYLGYFHISGRLRRGPFWRFIGIFVISIIWFLIFYTLRKFYRVYTYNNPELPFVDQILNIAGLIPYTAIFLASIPVFMRRLQDFNIPGYVALIWPILFLSSMYITGISSIVGPLILIIGAIPSTRGANRYGNTENETNAGSIS